jgi:hypothetical protein
MAIILDGLHCSIHGGKLGESSSLYDLLPRRPSNAGLGPGSHEEVPTSGSGGRRAACPKWSYRRRTSLLATRDHRPLAHFGHLTRQFRAGEGITARAQAGALEDRHPQAHGFVVRNDPSLIVLGEAGGDSTGWRGRR